MSTLLRRNLFSFLKVDPKTIPADELRKIRRDPFLRWDKHEDYFSRKPTNQEAQAFRHWVESQDVAGGSKSTNIESGAIQAQITPVWNGTILAVADKKWQFKPVPHTAGMEIDPADQPIVTVATMMLRVSEDKVLEPSLAPEVTKTGPLASVMTPASYAEYVARIGPYLEEKKLTNEREEKFAMEFYEHLHRSPRDEVSALRSITQNLFIKSKLAYDVQRKAVVADKRFVYEHGPVSVIKDEETGGNHYVPRSILKRLDMKIEVLPTVQKKEKDPASAMLSQLQSRFPARLMKYYGFRGFPDKNERFFLDLRPFLQLACPCDPTVMLEKWMKANGYEDSIRYSGDSLVTSTVQEVDVLLISRPYTETLSVNKSCILYGQVTFSKQFWAGYKILMYRPTCSGKFFYAPTSFDTSQLSKEYCSWPLTVLTNPASFTQFYKGFAAELLTLLCVGSFGSRGKLYESLKYPIDLKDYMIVDLTAIEDRDKLSTKQEKQGDDDGLAMTMVDFEGGPTITDNRKQAVVKEPAWGPRVHEMEEFVMNEVFDFVNEPPPFQNLLFPVNKAWDYLDDDEHDKIQYIKWNGKKYLIWGLVGETDWLVCPPGDLKAAFEWMDEQKTSQMSATPALVEHD